MFSKHDQVLDINDAVAPGHRADKQPDRSLSFYRKEEVILKLYLFKYTSMNLDLIK